MDESLEGEIGQPEIRADNDAGDQNHRRALDQLLLARPLDLLQLGDGLADEAPEAGARKLALDRRLRAGYAGRNLRLPRNGPSVAAVLLALLLGSAGTSLRSRLLGHCYLVSLCTVWRPHQRQYLRSSTRSGVFRLDFVVW